MHPWVSRARSRLFLIAQPQLHHSHHHSPTPFTPFLIAQPHSHHSHHPSSTPFTPFTPSQLNPIHTIHTITHNRRPLSHFRLSMSESATPITVSASIPPILALRKPLFPGSCHIYGVHFLRLENIKNVNFYLVKSNIFTSIILHSLKRSSIRFNGALFLPSAIFETSKKPFQN